MTAGSSCTLSAIRRRVRTLRQAASDFELETDRLKRIAARDASVDGAPRARLLIERSRSPAFAIMREKLREAEADLAGWRPAERKKLPANFGEMVSLALAGPIQESE